jgi:predicted nucleotidyltransferase
MRKRRPPTKAQGIAAAKKLHAILKEKGFPVQKVFLFGSVARGAIHPWSDIDIAVVHEPLGPSRYEEILTLCRAEHGSDLHNIEVIYFHPDDLGNKYSTIVQEVRREGIAVS